MNILPRFGAVGKHGSIAIVERFHRTLKEILRLVSSADLDTYDPATTKTPLERWETLSGTVTAPVGATTGRIVLGLKDYHPGASGVLQFDNARVIESEN